MMSQKDIEKRMKEIEEQIKDKQEEINDEIIPGSYFYDVDKVENLKKEIQKMQEEYEELDETPTIKKVDADLKDLNEKLALVEEELKEANGSYFLTDDMKELDEQRKELIETIADREETKQILVELEQIEKDLEDLEEEINDLSGAYFIPEDITKEKEEKENRKKELEEKLKDKKVKTKLKDIESVKDSKNKTKEEKEEDPKEKSEEPIDNPAPKDPPEKPIDNPQPTNPPKAPKGPETIIDTTHPTNPPKAPKGPETTIDTSSTKDKPDEPETIWTKIKNKVKDLWNTVKRNTKKALVGLGVGTLAISGTGVPIAEQEVEKTELKLDTKDFNFDLNIPQNPQDIASHLRVGDIITVDNLSGFETSDGTGKVGNTDYLTKSGSPISMIVTKIVEGKENGIHLSLYGKDAPQDLTVGGESNLVKTGEFQVAYLKRCMDDGMSQADAQKALDEILPYIDMDDIWTSEDAIAKGLEAQDITVTINGKIPILKAEKVTETKYTAIVKEDADKLRRPEDPMKEETHTGNRVRPGQERAKREPDDSKDARLERIKRAREKSKNMTQEDMDRLLDEMAENAKTKNNYSFGDEYRVDNKDSHIEAIAIASVAKKEQENKSVQQEKNDEDKTK